MSGREKGDLVAISCQLDVSADASDVVASGGGLPIQSWQNLNLVFVVVDSILTFTSFEVPITKECALTNHGLLSYTCAADLL